MIPLALAALDSAAKAVSVGTVSIFTTLFLAPSRRHGTIAVEGGETMNTNVADDIRRFFHIYQGRTSELMMQLPPPVRKELEEEIDLLRTSVLNRITEG